MLPRFRFGARSARHRDRADEIYAHIELQVEELVGRGVSPDEARRQARLMFGNPRAKLEEVDTLDRIPVIETLLGDLRTAYRSLRGAPGFTAAAIAVLTLAMGAGTAVFSVVDGVALRGLPFDDGDRIVRIVGKDKDRVVVGPYAAPEFLAFREQAHVFESLAAIAYGDVTLRRDGTMEPEVLRGQRVTAEFFSVLRVSPAMGRAFTSDAEVEGSTKVAVISHQLWQRRFGGSADVIGKHLPAVGGDVEVIGVMPEGFGYPIGAVEPTEVLTPYVIPAKERVTKFASYLTVIARLKNGTSIESTQQQLDAITEGRISSGALMGWDRRPTAVNLHESLVGDHRSWMLMLLASAACVLLIACVNIANLLLVRATVRVRELSVRAALGATRWTLTRMLLVESLLLSTIGAGFGTLVAWWSMEGLRALLPPDLPRLANIAVDWRVLTASAAAAIVTGIAFGLAPIFYSAKEIDQTLRQNGRTETTGQRRQLLRATLLVAEVAITVVLLIGASLFLTSFWRLMRIDIGLDPSNVTTIALRPPADPANAARLETLLDRIRQMPSVQATALALDNVPFSLRVSSAPFGIPGRVLRPDQPGGMNVAQVSADYFSTLRVRLVEGRLFTAADVQADAPVAILNQSAASLYFPNENPIGARIELRGDRIVVGVVGDVRGFGPERDARPESFLPLADGKFAAGTLIVRTAGNNTAINADLKAAIRMAFPDMIIPAPRTFEQSLGRLIAERRFSMFLLSLFGAIGLLIASVGIYGVMSYLVAQQRREVGIRMALGAQRSTILWAVLRRASVHVSLGLAGGLTLSWLLSTLVEKFLFRVEAHELPLYAAACGELAVAALVAAYLPSRRASRLDPLTVLRLE